MRILEGGKVGGWLFVVCWAVVGWADVPITSRYQVVRL
ncbi:MAG: hypothetical protein ACI9R8_001982 [Candidatus Paceibacteria bacterium]|jgi:hypothetical protein